MAVVILHEGGFRVLRMCNTAAQACHEGSWTSELRLKDKEFTGQGKRRARHPVSSRKERQKAGWVEPLQLRGLSHQMGTV